MREFLYKKRKELNLSQSEVAKKSGISRTFYTQIENDTKNASVTVSKKIAEVLQTDWTLFFDNN